MSGKSTFSSSTWFGLYYRSPLLRVPFETNRLNVLRHAHYLRLLGKITISRGRGWWPSFVFGEIKVLVKREV